LRVLRTEWEEIIWPEERSGDRSRRKLFNVQLRNLYSLPRRMRWADTVARLGPKGMRASGEEVRKKEAAKKI
jgi:hypothetical protein